MTWFNEFNAVFFTTITTILTGSIGLALRYCLRSKCENFSCCWGLLNIQRNVVVEVQEEMKEMELGINNSPNRSQNNLNTNQDNNII